MVRQFQKNPINSKRKKNSELSTTKPKKKKEEKIPPQIISKQLEQEQNHRNGDHIEGRGQGKNGKKGTGNKKHKWQVQNRQEEVKNSKGNGEAKELIGMTHERELSGVDCWREGGYCAEGGKKKKTGTAVIT